MVRVTKFNNTNLSDALLNETSLFWDSSDPASGLPANTWFLNTAQQILKQNTGTEGSPTWTVRLAGMDRGTTFPTSPIEADLFNDTRLSELFQYVDAHWNSVQKTYSVYTPADLDLLESFRRPDVESTFWAGGSSVNVVSVADDRINWQTDRSVDGLLHYDLQQSEALNGSNASDSAWVLRFKMPITSKAAGPSDNSETGCLIGLSDDIINTSGVKDFIGLKISHSSVLDVFAALDTDEGDLLAAGQAFAATPAVQDYWVEIIRTSTTAATVELFSDEFVTSIEKETLVVATTTDALRYIYLATIDLVTTHDGKIAGNIPWIQFFDGVTSVT